MAALEEHGRTIRGQKAKKPTLEGLALHEGSVGAPRTEMHGALAPAVARRQVSSVQDRFNWRMTLATLVVMTSTAGPLAPCGKITSA